MQRISLSMGNGRDFKDEEFTIPDNFDAKIIIRHWIGEELKKRDWGAHISIIQSIRTITDIELEKTDGN